MNALRRALRVAVLVVLPATAGGYQERLVLAADAGGGCSLRLEADDEAGGLRLRVAPEGRRCRVARETVRQLLAAAFSRSGPPRLEGTYRTLHLGRLVSFPWLAAQVVNGAATDGGWDRRRGRPVAAGINGYVAALLSRREVTAPLEGPLAAAGYRIVAATVEKVLVAELRDAGEYEGPRPPGKLPFDAMVWFRLERAPADGR